VIHGDVDLGNWCRTADERDAGAAGADRDAYAAVGVELRRRRARVRSGVRRATRSGSIDAVS
jgi:hypothetical protein